MVFNAAYFVHSSRQMLRLLGERLRERRVAARFTQASLAGRAGVSRDTVTRIERGDNIGLEPLLLLAIALDATAEFAALFPPKDTRSLDQILATQRKTQRVRD